MIYLLQPPREDGTISGGYRFNAEIGRRLDAMQWGCVMEVGPAELKTRLNRLADSRPDDVVVIDSLYITMIGAPEWLSSNAALRRASLLLHYLPSTNPLLSIAEREMFATLERTWLGVVNGVIATSTVLANRIAGRYHGPAIRVASPGVDACFQPLPVNPAIEAYAGVTIIAIGPLIPAKGQLEIADALAPLSSGLVPIRLVLVGDHEADPEYTKSLKKRAEGLDLVLTGNLEPHEVAKRLHGADLFVSASSYESYGMAVAEALATGLPVLSYRTGEVEDWVQPGVNGLLADDRDALHAHLRELVTSPEEISRLRPRRVDTTFPSWEDSFADFLSACRREVVRGEPVKIADDDIVLYAACDLPTEFGTFKIEVYRGGGRAESVLIGMGDLAAEEPPFVRIHSECFTGEVLHSLKCDCREQLLAALKTIVERKRGAIVYLKQEGRGIGLGNKILAYAEQAKGANTVEANELLGFPADLRNFTAAASILKQKSVRRCLLNTNNPGKAESLEANGITVDRMIPSVTDPNPFNLDYLQTKLDVLGHAGLEEVLRKVQRGSTK